MAITFGLSDTALNRVSGKLFEEFHEVFSGSRNMDRTDVEIDKIQLGDYKLSWALLEKPKFCIATSEEKPIFKLIIPEIKLQFERVKGDNPEGLVDPKKDHFTIQATYVVDLKAEKENSTFRMQLLDFDYSPPKSDLHKYALEKGFLPGLRDGESKRDVFSHCMKKFIQSIKLPSISEFAPKSVRVQNPSWGIEKEHLFISCEVNKSSLKDAWIQEFSSSLQHKWEGADCPSDNIFLRIDNNSLRDIIMQHLNTLEKTLGTTNSSKSFQASSWWRIYDAVNRDIQYLAESKLQLSLTDPEVIVRESEDYVSVSGFLSGEGTLGMRNPFSEKEASNFENTPKCSLSGNIQLKRATINAEAHLDYREDPDKKEYTIVSEAGLETQNITSSWVNKVFRGDTPAILVHGEIGEKAFVETICQDILKQDISTILAIIPPIQVTSLNNCGNEEHSAFNLLPKGLKLESGKTNSTLKGNVTVVDSQSLKPKYLSVSRFHKLPPAQETTSERTSTLSAKLG